MIYRVTRTEYDVCNNVEIEGDGGTPLGCFTSWDAAERKVESDFLDMMEGYRRLHKALWGDRDGGHRPKTAEECQAMLPLHYTVVDDARHYSLAGYMFDYTVHSETLDGQ